MIETYKSWNWFRVEECEPEDELPVLVILSHTYESEHKEYSIARYVNINGEKYWHDKEYGYLEHPKYSNTLSGSTFFKVIAWKPIELKVNDESVNNEVAMYEMGKKDGYKKGFNDCKEKLKNIITEINIENCLKD